MENTLLILEFASLASKEHTSTEDTQRMAEIPDILHMTPEAIMEKALLVALKNVM